MRFAFILTVLVAPRHPRTVAMLCRFIGAPAFPRRSTCSQDDVVVFLLSL